jgi:hypothetical protein
MVKVLVDFLKNRQIASDDDFPAFQFANASNVAIFLRAKELYLETAKEVGETDWPKPLMATSFLSITYIHPLRPSPAKPPFFAVQPNPRGDCPSPQ